jgi:hypothetical protein
MCKQTNISEMELRCPEASEIEVSPIRGLSASKARARWLLLLLPPPHVRDALGPLGPPRERLHPTVYATVPRDSMEIDEKSSSIKMMLDTSLATSVRVVPIENSMCTVLRAGASFMLSPVTPIILPLSLSVSTINRLSPCEDRARTCNRGAIAFMISGESMRK